MAKNGNFWVGMLVGAVAGSVTALLLAPKTGDEMRGDIAEGARDMGRKAGAAWGDVKDRASHVAGGAKEGVQMAAGRGREAAAGARERIQEAVQAGRRAAREKRAEMQAEVEAKKHEAAG